MAKKKKLNYYSTNPDFVWEEGEEDAIETLEPAKQKLRVLRDRKQRKGKEVTLVTGFIGSDEDLQTLGKKLKSKCGVGGSVKDGEIMIQGNQIQKAVQLLLDWGYSKTKQSGG
jgi:translation initiation factor 1